MFVKSGVAILKKKKLNWGKKKNPKLVIFISGDLPGLLFKDKSSQLKHKAAMNFDFKQIQLYWSINSMFEMLEIPLSQTAL